MKLLERPAGVVHEPVGQPVEQFRDAWAASPITPKSPGVRTSPSPKCCCQTRLTMTRAVSGFASLVSQPARPSRRCEVRSPGGGKGNGARLLVRIDWQCRFHCLAGSARAAAFQDVRRWGEGGFFAPGVGFGGGRIGGWHGLFGAAVLRPFERSEDREHRVIIALGQRFELVVVAAGAAERQAEQRLPRSCGRCRRAGRIGPPPDRPGSSSQCPSRRKPVAMMVSAVASGSSSPAICSMMNRSKRLVGVEGADDVIAIAPDERLGGVALVAVAVRIADHVEPVSRPAFAIGRPGEEVVEEVIDERRRSRSRPWLRGLWIDARASTSAGVGGNPVRSRWARRNRTAAEAGGAGFFSRGFQLGQDEGIDGIPHPGPVLDLGNRRPPHRLERPMRLRPGQRGGRTRRAVRRMRQRRITIATNRQIRGRVESKPCGE